ncbi:hypothetical protein G2W53_031613 [Senna tora]|uniref:Uncharacterized protein n=1 Tax=Senna tora TaxID=362788 RepID=A0A834T921_9FABA|nr:hypothetical protein G2W53_031613 [Senna tora]
MEHAGRDAVHRLVQECVNGRVERAASAATVCHRVLPVIKTMVDSPAPTHPPQTIVLARGGASYRRGHDYANGPAARAVHAAAVYLLELPVTMKSAPATPI